jgi:hypothetical protein
MALFSECTDRYAQKLLDTADIVRDAILRKSTRSYAVNSFRSIDFPLTAKVRFAPVTARAQLASNPRKLFLRAMLFLLSCSAVAGECSLPIILVNTADRDFKIQASLEATDLSVEVDGRRVQIRSLSPDNRPRRIVVMIDSSGSMEASLQKRGWGVGLATADYAVDVVPASATVALVTFSDKLQRESSGFENPKVVGTRVVDLKRTEPHRMTRLFDSIHQVLTDFTELQSGDAIYLVTDGGDNKSVISPGKLRQELIVRGIRVFLFLVSSLNVFHTAEELDGASEIQRLAEFTGGDIVPISAAAIAGADRAQLEKLAPHIVSEVESVYRMELGISAPGKPAHVKVSFTDRKRARNGHIAYSHEIAPCLPSGAVN